MCLKVNCAYSHGRSAAATLDVGGPVEIAFATESTSIPVSCMRAQSDHSGSQLFCLCHLDDGGYSSDNATLETSICYEPSRIATKVDIENDFPPLSSSPPEVASSSPHSVSASSDEDGSVENFMSSSPFDIPSLAGRNLAQNSEGSPRRATHLKHTLLENEHVKSGPILTPSKTCWSSRSSPFDSTMRTVHDSYVPNRSCSYPRIDSHTGSDDSRPISAGVCSCTDNGQLDLMPSPNSVVEITPITFSANDEIQQLSYPKIVHQNPMYRLIKRPRSYSNLRLEEPSPKRKKTHYGPNSDYSRRVYAPRNASLRRAESLKTTSDLNSPQSSDLEINPPPKVGLPPRRPRRWRAKEKVIPHPVPIIAPPEDHVVGLPVSEESLAIMRVKKFLEREFDQRAVEGLSADFFYAGTTAMSLLIDADIPENPSTNKWEGALGIGRETRLSAINWLLNVKPMIFERPASVDSPCSVASTISLGSSSASSTTVGSPTEDMHNLSDQLQTSQGTRFHACWMFLRYFYLVMSPGTFTFPERVSSWPDGLTSDRRSKLEREGHELVILDISVACLSLSVKYHRDFLDPLLPVYAQEYLALSPHGMSYDDLETAHRDVLSAFGYRLGVSPQPLMDELWFALPSLRELLCFERGWSHAMNHAWTILFRAVSEVDVQMFSVSLLTTVAIMEGVIQSLAHQDQNESTDSRYQRSRILGPNTSNHSSRPINTTPSCPDISQEQARREAEHVLCEMQALVGVSDMHLRICRLWMKKFEA